MRPKGSRRKRQRALCGRIDKTVAAVAVLMVTLVLLLVGFSGPSVAINLPGRAGWMYIGAVLGAGILALVVLFRKINEGKINRKRL